MQELWFSAVDGDCKAAFAFDMEHKAILLVAGDKSGSSEKRFYYRLIRKADVCSAHCHILYRLGESFKDPTLYLFAFAIEKLLKVYLRPRNSCRNIRVAWLRVCTAKLISNIIYSS